MKLIVAIFLLFPLITFAQPFEQEKGNLYSEVINRFAFSFKWEPASIMNTSISGRCFRYDSSIPYGSVVLINSEIVDAGPIGNQKMVARGIRLSSMNPSEFDSKNYFEIMNTLSDDQLNHITEFIDETNETILSNMSFRKDQYNDYIYGVDASKQFACYFFSYN